jgi:cell division protein FtsL
MNNNSFHGGDKMKSFKENWTVKTVYAYLDLFLKLFPIVILFYIAPAVISLLSIGEMKLSKLDFFNLLSVSEQVSHSEKVLLCIYLIIVDVIILYCIYMILKKLTVFIKNVFENNPFIEENGNHLKYVGKAILLLTVVYHISKITNSSDVISNLSVAVNILTKLSWLISIVFSPYLIIGLFIFVMGEIIIYAAKLKEENDLTV